MIVIVRGDDHDCSRDRACRRGRGRDHARVLCLDRALSLLPLYRRVLQVCPFDI